MVATPRLPLAFEPTGTGRPTRGGLMQLFTTRRRRAATAMAIAALVAAPLVGAVAADAAIATGTVDTTGNPGPPLTVRAKPTSASDAVGKRSDGATVTI